MTEIRRVLMTADTIGGVWSFTLDLARSLSRSGVEVVLATMGAPLTGAQRSDASQIEQLRLCESSLSLEWMEDPWADVAHAGEWLLALEAELRPEVVHLSSYAHAALAFDAPVVLTAHSSVTSWWRAVFREEAPDCWARYRRAVLRGVGAARAVVTPSAAMQRDLEADVGQALPSVRVIPNGIWTEDYRPEQKEAFILAAGRLWDQGKNAAAVAEAAHGLAWPVRIAGDATSPTGESPSFAGVELLGRLDRRAVATWMGRAAIFAHPARYEPFGLAPLEAAASGCALVLGDLASQREIWGDAAVYVEPTSVGALRDVLGELLEDTARRDALGQRAQARAAELHASTMGARYLGLYEELAKRPLAAPEPPRPTASAPANAAAALHTRAEETH